MNNRGQLNVGMILLLAVGIIIALAMFPAIAQNSDAMTDKQVIVNDSITTAAHAKTAAGQVNESNSFNVSHAVAATDWRYTSCPTTSVSLTNSTGAAYTETTDYVFNDNYGNFTLVNTATVNASTLSDNLTYVSYTYCDSGYVGDSTAGTVVKLILIFAALGLLGFVIYWSVGQAGWLKN